MARLSPGLLKQQLKLNDHIEGGGFSEVYRSLLVFTSDQLPPQFTGSRPACTHIHFMLEKGQFSAFHRIRSDELWHFYSGDPLIVYEIDETGILIEHLLGSDPGAGQSFFCVIKGGNWFASRLAGEGEYGLVGCTVAPGFDFADFELAKKDELLHQFPDHAALINALCRK
jgi:predicted cupin superfamily sugar epimerase